MDGADCINYIINNNIEGCLVECGVEYGKMETIWINELQKHNIYRDIYMFDTFGGLTKPGINDYACETGPVHLYKDSDSLLKEWENKKINEYVNGWCFCPLDKIIYNLNKTNYPSKYLHYIVGNVCETLENEINIPQNIAVLRLDTDWYESSKIELIKLFPNVVKGGVIIFDDYYFWNGQRQATSEFFSEINERYEFIKVNSQTESIIKK